MFWASSRTCLLLAYPYNNPSNLLASAVSLHISFGLMSHQPEHENKSEFMSEYLRQKGRSAHTGVKNGSGGAPERAFPRGRTRFYDDLGQLKEGGEEGTARSFGTRE